MKNYEELTFADDFMFCKIMEENEDLCKELTELVLERKIGKIVKNEKQKAIEPAADGHGVRLDVYFEDDENTIYDIEMQNSDTKELPLRSRYYQGMMDLGHLDKGVKYSELPNSYVVFLCTFDLFKKGYHKYSFVPMCREVDGLKLEDKTTRVFVCAGGDKDDVSDEMKSFIDRLSGKNTKSDLMNRIEAKVKDAIERGLWRKEYMTLKDKLDEEFDRGIEQGRMLDRIEMVCGKLTKGLDAAIIADHLDLPIDQVNAIVEVAKKFAPDYDAEKIYEELTKERPEEK